MGKEESLGWGNSRSVTDISASGLMTNGYRFLSPSRLGGAPGHSSAAPAVSEYFRLNGVIAARIKLP
jgi:hypothetical protein